MKKDIREVFLEFLDDQELSGILNHSSIMTKAVDKDLRYIRIDRYNFSFLTKDQLTKILEFTCKFHEYIDIYFAFGQLCIGYYDGGNGVQKRLVAFSKAEAR